MSLTDLHLSIDQRVVAIRAEAPDWLCAKGCANCCRRLAEVPQLTEAEWALLHEGLAALSTEHLALIAQRMQALAQQTTRPLTCPMLDEATNACPVYLQRPVVCRSYGFYARRDGGLYCSEIEAQVAAGLHATVVWGNHEAVERELAGMGEVRPLTEWFARWQGEADGGGFPC
ncbi:YkgJ family cysteine cluster protein [Uliginosibacterium sp. 31-16]|uniref:YkgJ family cysteine cluster protein n=1 Tax=Uliginosibacterium sp. 31-16 TaxID=3068315 RepID=UPI00273F8932|nr:YkgJ family cysteine cluster protein [Uliginosibacterium sp. 31-16]MDP5238026.1 YkgJ family cysteine cluster protein [Uliginosibacterium sp. 31-16]